MDISSLTNEIIAGRRLTADDDLTGLFAVPLSLHLPALACKRSAPPQTG